MMKQDKNEKSQTTFQIILYQIFKHDARLTEISSVVFIVFFVALILCLIWLLVQIILIL